MTTATPPSSQAGLQSFIPPTIPTPSIESLPSENRPPRGIA